MSFFFWASRYCLLLTFLKKTAKKFAYVVIVSYFCNETNK